jgi:hypothetical protein
MQHKSWLNSAFRIHPDAHALALYESWIASTPGWQTEEERLAPEAFAAWPEMGAMRRCFRFLGKVASEGKRLFVIATEKNKKNPK